MDPSNSHPPCPTSDPGSSSNSQYSSSFSTGSSSAEETSLSAENTTQRKTTSVSDQLENEEDVYVDITDSPKPTEVQPKSSAGKRKMMDTGESSGSGGEGKAEEIGLLTDLYSLHEKTGRYYSSGVNAKRDFYKFWIQEERAYKNKEELDNKIEELHARFLKNRDESVEGPTDPIDVEILRLSEWIWGNEIEWFEETDQDDDDSNDQEEGSKDLTDANVVDPNAAGDGNDQEEGSKDATEANAVDPNAADDQEEGSKDLTDANIVDPNAADDQEEGSKDLTDANDPNASGDDGVDRMDTKDSGPVNPIKKD